MTKFHVLAIPTTEEGMAPGLDVGWAETIEEAVKLVRDAGHDVIEEGNGGSYDRYDDDDAPRIYGYEPDGFGAISVTVWDKSVV